MNRLITIVLTCLCVASCTNNGYVINGTIADSHLDGKTIYKVSSVRDDKTKPQIDSTIIKDGKYRFSGEVINPDYCNIYIPSNSRTVPPIIYSIVALEKGTINISTNENNETTVSGTPFNDSYQSYYSGYLNLSKKFAKANNRIENAKRDGIELSVDEVDSLNNIIRDCRQKFISVKYNYVKENINNPATWYVDLHNAAYSEATLEGKKALLKGVNDYTKTTPAYKKIVAVIELLEKTSVGKPFTDFAMNDKDGNKVSLSDYVGKGKYVLLDFWASWCGPCRAEMPNVLEAHKKFAGKDFEIVGVSLDTKEASWKKAVEELNLPWPQLSDLKGWECEGAKLYGVSGIPATVLFDRNGTIIARNLRGDELAYELRKLLKQ